MGKYTSAVAIFAALSTPAFAWTNTNYGHGNQIVDGGPGAQSNSYQQQHQTAAGGAGGAGGSASGGSAAGGSAASSATGGAASAGSSLSGVGNTTINARSAPSMGLPSIGGGGFDCPVVGFGAVGAGLGGGGGIGPTWISKSCNNRKVTEMLYGLFGPGVAREFAIANIDGVAAAVAAASQTNVVVVEAMPVPPAPPGGWVGHCDHVGADGYCSAAPVVHHKPQHKVKCVK